MDDVLPTIVAIGLGGLLFMPLQRRLDQRWEVSWLGFALVAHLVAPFAQVAISRGFYGGGDMMGYHRTGVFLARIVRADPWRFLPEIVGMVAHRVPNLPVQVNGSGYATGGMNGLVTLAALVANDSIYAIAILFSLLSFSGSWALYIVFRETFPASLRQRLVITCMGLPSVVFWTSGILKESVAVAGFGWVLFGTFRISHGRHAVGWPAALIGAALIAAVKPYVLIAYVASVGVYFYWRRAIQRDGAIRVRPVYFVLFAGLGVAALLGLGKVFPRYAISTLVDETSAMQTVGARMSGGSNYSVGATGGGVVTQIVSAPLALATTLFRPLPFEVSSVTMAMNAVETSLLTGWLGLVLWRRRWAEIWTLTTRSPLLMFSAVFILLFGVAVGLASTNLGSLSRYRAPLMPLFASMIAIWGGWRPSPLARRAPARPPPRRIVRRRRPIPSEAT